MNEPSSLLPAHVAAEVAALRTRAAQQARSGQLSTAIATCRQALEAAPDHPEVLADLGHVALRMGEAKMAEVLFGRVYATNPSDPETADNLARALRDQHRYDDAAAVLRSILEPSPAQPILWNTLGTVLNAQGDSLAALSAFDEALRQAPRFAAARYNRSGVLMDQGSTQAALAECEAALDIADATAQAEGSGGGDPGEAAMMRMGRAEMLLAFGRLEEGWAAYEARLDTALPNPTTFDIPFPRLGPHMPLAGLKLLVVGEQGLGDEIMFAGLIPDVLEALRPDGRLTLTAEPRLAPLFTRSFPAAHVIPHATIHQEGRTRRSASNQTPGRRSPPCLRG
jgi:tetratricopeptide (TPR) repeat protein